MQEYNYFWNYNSFFRCWPRIVNVFVSLCNLRLHPDFSIDAFGHRVNFSGKKVIALPPTPPLVRRWPCAYDLNKTLRDLSC